MSSAPLTVSVPPAPVWSSLERVTGLPSLSGSVKSGAFCPGKSRVAGCQRKKER
jgi:hypothetical protein